MASQPITTPYCALSVAGKVDEGDDTATRIIRGSGKAESIRVWDQFTLMYSSTVKGMIERFRKNDVPTNGYFLPKRGTGAPVAITIPPHTNFVHFLRHMYAEQGAGKLYLPRQLSVWGGSRPSHLSNWEVVMWGGGRQKANKIKIVDVRHSQVPRVLKLLDMVNPHGQDVASNT